MKKITIIDYGCGNLLSLSRAIEEIGFSCHITSEKKKILGSDILFLPGVGAFENAINLLKKNGLIDIINEYANHKKPLIGICLGMQLLLTKSFELGEHSGLNLIEGQVINIKEKSINKNIKIPHIKWNNILKSCNQNNFLNEKIFNKNYYFIHSYMTMLSEKKNVLAYTKYFDIEIPSIVFKNNIIGFQFHPEKSGENGLSLLKETLKIF